MPTPWSDVRVLLRFNHSMLTRVLDGLPDEAMDAPMAPGCNTPRWVLAHLAVSLDLTLLSIGVPTLLPREWLAQFGPGSSGQFGAITSPTRAELMTMISRGVDAVDAALADDSPERAARFGRSHKARLLMGTGIETIGQTVLHLCTTHFALHVGQLTLARRGRGMRPVLRAE